MALTDKDIVITPNRGQSADPKVEFKGASSTLGPQTISLNVYPTSNGTLSFEGSAGQLFSITNTLTGTIYSVNDVSGIPSIEVLDTGLVKLAQYSGNVLVGTGTDDGSKLQVRGSLRAGNGGWNSSPAGTTFSHTIAANTGNFRTVNFDGNGNTPSVWWTNGSRPYGAIDAQDPGLTFWAHNGSGWQKQITMNYGTVNIDTALQQGGNQVLHAGNYNSYAPTLTGGNASGTWGINITGSAATATDSTKLPLTGGTITGTIRIDGGGSQPLTISTSSSSPWAFGLIRTDTGADSKIFLHNPGSGSAWIFEHIPYFYNGGNYNVPLHNGNYGSYALPLSGGTLTGNLTMNGAGNSTSIIFGENTKQINVEGYWMMFKGHQNEGFRWQTTDGSTYTTRMQLTSSNLTLNTNGFIDFGPNTTWSSTLRVGGNGHGGSGRASVVTTDGNLHLDGGGSGTGLYLNYYVNGPIYATSSAHVVIHAGNYNSYAPTLTGGSASGTWPISVTGTSAGLALSGGFTIDTPGSGYARFNNWVNLSGAHGFYSSVNNAHIYPNNGSYGAWRVAGSRNSWNGIEFDTNTGNVSLMIDMSGNTSGFHHNNYGWQMRWNNGTGYINKNAYGAGTEATILDSSNYTNYTNGVFLRAAGGNDAMNFNTTQYNTMYYAYIANSPNKPPGYNYSYGTIITFDPGVGVAGRAQFYVSHAGNDLIFRGGWNANDSWQTWNRVLTDQNYTSWAPSLTGSGASGTWGISITGSAASAASVPASGITGQTGMWTSTARPGPYRLYRRDNDSNYSVQTYWTGTRWRLYGYSGDDGHADTHVGYADSAGSSGSSGDANYLITGDNRIIAPSEDTAYRMRFGFTSWNNNNDPPWADYLHMRSYGDNSGGSDNLVMFLKNGFGIRIWQQVFGSGSAYSDYRDVLTSGNYNSYALPISGGTATGRVSISVNGRTTGYSGSNFEVFTSDNTPPGISFHRGGYSATLLYENDGELYTNPWTSRAQTGKLLAAGNYNSYAPTLTGGGASGTWGINITGNAGGVGGYVVSTSPSANTIPTRNNSGYLSPGSWIQFDGAYGLYWPNNNNAHIHANDLSSYAPVVIRGSRSGYHGIAMYDMPQGGGNGHWMSNGNASGYYNESYGWKFFHESGNFYIHSGTYGGGTSYTALHSGNYTSYSPTLLGAGASGTWNINITGTGTDPNKVPLTGGTMTGTLFINSKLRVNNASGPSDSTYGTAADIPMHMSGNTRTQTTFLIENTVNSSIDYPVIVIRRTLTPVGSRFGGMIRFADKNSSGTEISSQIYSFNRLTSQDLFLDAGSGTEDRVVLRAGSSSSMQVAENFIMNVKAAIYAVTTPAALDIDCKQSNYFTKTINGDSTFTFSNVPAPSGFTIAYSFTLELTHTSGTVTWPASVRWPGNVLPSLTTGKTHLFMFVTDDGGSRWRGSFLSNYDN